MPNKNLIDEMLGLQRSEFKTKHLTLTQMPLQAGRKTSVWSVWNHHYGEKLGELRWYAPWRQYCFVDDTKVYSAGCLSDIAEALNKIAGESHA